MRPKSPFKYSPIDNQTPTSRLFSSSNWLSSCSRSAWTLCSVRPSSSLRWCSRASSSRCFSMAIICAICFCSCSMRRCACAIREFSSSSDMVPTRTGELKVGINSYSEISHFPCLLFYMSRDRNRNSLFLFWKINYLCFEKSHWTDV